MNKSTLQIGGYVPLSTVDYPQHLAAVVFCQGCPWKCRYCHNINLNSPKTPGTHDWETIYNALQRRKTLLDAVVFSGGEPTLQKQLIEVIKQTKELGFKIGLHTGGMYPTRLALLLPYIDWIGFDIKSNIDSYSKVTGIKNSGKYIWDSLNLIINAKIPFECRTTIHQDIHDVKSLITLGDTLATKGVSNYFLQICRADNVLDSSLSTSYISKNMKEELHASLNTKFENFDFRD